MSQAIILRESWAIKSSVEVKVDGGVISTLDFSPEGWHVTSVPTTVLAALVKAGVYPDPYYSTNILKIGGKMAPDVSIVPPFDVPWWYRTVFKLPADYKGKRIWLNLQGINYAADIWLNGHMVVDRNTIEGPYRIFQIEITDYVFPGRENCLALKIYPPRGTYLDLTIAWVDWNPTPPDLDTGIWYPVKITASGPVKMRNPFVATDLDLPSLDVAHLEISVELTNLLSEPMNGILHGEISNVNNIDEGGTSIGGPEAIQFSKEVSLEAGETKLVKHKLDIINPRIWWPIHRGTQQLYDLKLSFLVNGEVSDTEKVRFGIRKVSSWMNVFDGKRTRVFQINGENIVIRGAEYVDDMMMQYSPEMEEAAVKYAIAMNLNALRLEGPRGSDYLYELCDKYGILIMAGLCCCSTWEHWSAWTPHIADVAVWSWRDQVIRWRNHPSVFLYAYGSDKYPPPEVEARYIEVLNKYDPTRPYISSCTSAPSKIAGHTGVYMGPWPDVYAYYPPSYWYTKLEFNTECGPSGEQVSPIESLRKMMPEEELWPPTTPSWMARLHPSFYTKMRAALYSRYGEPTTLEEYCMKSQVLQYEAVRATFEAFAHNKYFSSGVIFWQLNSAWPTLYWQLYDYYLKPNGAFYGAQIACEPLHVYYNYVDGSVYVINGYYKSFENLEAFVKVLNFDMTEKFSASAIINAGPDSIKYVLTIPALENLSSVYFIKLELKDSGGNLISSNFYWLSTKGDENADFTQLMKLPTVDLDVTVELEVKNDEYIVRVTFVNPTNSLAFFINSSILKGLHGPEVLPTFWNSNYFNLIPGEKRNVTATFAKKTLGTEDPYLKIEGWNIKPKEINLRTIQSSRLC